MGQPVKVSVFHRISVDDRRKLTQKYAFSNENGLMWTGPEIDDETERKKQEIQREKDERRLREVREADGKKNSKRN